MPGGCGGYGGLVLAGVWGMVLGFHWILVLEGEMLGVAISALYFFLDEKVPKNQGCIHF